MTSAGYTEAAHSLYCPVPSKLLTPTASRGLNTHCHGPWAYWQEALGREQEEANGLEKVEQPSSGNKRPDKGQGKVGGTQEYRVKRRQEGRHEDPIGSNVRGG